MWWSHQKHCDSNDNDDDAKVGVGPLFKPDKPYCCYLFWCFDTGTVDIDHLGDKVDPGDAQAADHNQHHHKATAYKNIPVGQNA